MSAILRADAPLLLRLAEVMPQSGLLPRADTAEEPAPVQGDPARARGMCSGGEVREPSPASIRALLVTAVPTAPMRWEDLARATHAAPRRTETPGTGWTARLRRGTSRQGA
jgi:hypothetical protein